MNKIVDLYIFRKYFDTNWIEVKQSAGFVVRTLKKLKAYTMYYIEIRGYNSMGMGPVDTQVLRTEQGGS